MVFCLSYGLSETFGQNNNPPPDMSIFDEEGQLSIEELTRQYLLDEINGVSKPRDLILSSATIFAFIGFASFLTIRIRKRRRFLLKFLGAILISLYVIGVIQIYVIISIISNYFIPMLYVGLMLAVATAFGSMLYFTYRFVSEQSSDEKISDIWEQMEQRFSNILNPNEEEDEEKGEDEDEE